MISALLPKTLPHPGMWSVVLLLLFPVGLDAQVDTTDIYDLSLTQLAKLRVSSASKVSQGADEVPSTVHVITAERIRENGYVTLEEALSDLPGFQFRDILGINSYVFQRGIPNQNNLILLLIDGVQVNELNSGGFYAGAQYNHANVERIEVVYGPASVMYGTNAVSGIINIITRDAVDNTASARALAGGFGTRRIDLRCAYRTADDGFGVAVSGMAGTTRKADLAGAAGDWNWTDRMDNYENDYSLDVKAHAGDFTAGLNFIDKQTSTATLMKSVGTAYRDYGTMWNIRFINGHVSYRKDLSGALSISASVYDRNATVLDNTVYWVLDTAQIGYYRPNNLVGCEGIMNYVAGGWFALTGGVTAENERLARQNTSSASTSPDVKPPTPPDPEMLDNNVTSVFLEPRLTLMKGVRVSGGARYDNSSYYGEVLTPRAGITWSWRAHILRFSYAEAFRAPKPWDYTDGLGNAGLTSERMRSFETGLSIALSGHLKFDAAVYRNTLTGAIIKETGADGFRWINGGEVRTNGVELYLRYESRALDCDVNYTFNESTDEHGAFVPEISRHVANAGATWRAGTLLAVNLRVNYVGPRLNPRIIAATNDDVIASHAVFHLALTLPDFHGFTAQVAVKNLFNAEYYDSSNREIDRYRQPQRTILFTIGHTLSW